MSHHLGEKKVIFQAMGSNIHETLIFNTEPLECRSKQLCEEAKGRNRAAGEETELPEWEWHRQAATPRSPVDVARQAQWPEQSSSWQGEPLRTLVSMWLLLSPSLNPPPLVAWPPPALPSSSVL